MGTLHTAAASALTLLITLGASSAEAGEPIAVLNGADSVASDNLGAAVAVSGTTAIVAAPRDDVSGTLSGSAYLFNLSTGQQIAKLVPDDGAAFDSFGFAVSISGNNAMASSYKDDDNGSTSGSVYLFDSSSGLQLDKFAPADGALGDQFGFSLGLSGNIAVIGAPGDDDNGAGAGSAYLFDVSTGMQLFKLTASDGAASDLFGNSSAIEGNTVIVGAPGKNGSQGAAYLFDATTGLQTHKLTAGSPQANAFFGRAVAVNGDRAVVGSPFATFGAPSVGVAYLFDTTSGSQLTTLLASDAVSNDRFGESIALSGAQILVSANNHDAFGNSSGAAYVYDVNTGSQTSQLTAPNGKANDRFGWSVGLSGDRSVVGVIGAFGSAVNSGNALGFQLSGDIWTNLGLGKQGLAGVPSLIGLGDLSSESELCLGLGQAAPGAPAFLVVGVSNLSAGFKGGVLVPSPDLILSGLFTDPAGQLVIDTTWPSGAAPGVPLYLQLWVTDASASQLFAASNGITKITP